MKKGIFVIALIAGMYSCNSNGKNDTSDDTTGKNVPGIENVNGNLPDTTNAMPIDEKKDTGTRRDSAR